MGLSLLLLCGISTFRLSLVRKPSGLELRLPKFTVSVYGLYHRGLNNQNRGSFKGIYIRDTIRDL